MPVRQEGPRGFEMDDPDLETSELPAPTFATFVLSLSTSVLLHLGVVTEQGEQAAERPEPNLPLARHSIEILEMLRDKTQGNRDADEDRLLSEILHDLHMRYVEAKKATQ